MVKILTGPVIGTVTSHSIRLLLEVDTSCQLRAICNESKNHDGSHITVSALSFEARRPRAVTINGLRSATEYIVEFVVEENAAVGSGVDDEGRPISGMGDDELENGEERVAQVSTFGRKGEEHNNGTSSSTPVVQPTDIANGTSSWAHRVAVVSGNDQARVLAGESMWKTLSDRVYVNKVKTLDLMIHTSGQIRGEEAFKAAKQELASVEGDLSEEQENQVAELYRDLYRKNWNHKPIQKLLASASNVMFMGSMDICDGWGSQESHRSPDSIDFKIALIARRIYWEYQRQLREDIPESNSNDWSKQHEGYHHVLDTLGILFVDTVASSTFLPALGTGETESLLSANQLEDIKAKLLASDNGVFHDANALLCVTASPIALATQDSDLAKHFASEGNAFVTGRFNKDRIVLLDAISKWRDQVSTRNVLLVAGGTNCGCHSILSVRDTTLEQIVTSPICREIPTNTEDIATCEGKEQVIDDNVKVAHSNVCVEENMGIIDIFLGTESKKQRTNITSIIIKKSSRSSSTGAAWDIQGTPDNQGCCVIS